ncbi:Transcription antitermination protein NusG [hydrothermal vent metagenome]|jgi:transcription termination/antitermination protein NusG|uniref:Transcription antitermination protein NusG n=1 Tax=hydrothermal vent metagenome TaxID=652676 RepID=A0A3B0SN33_9ZZZZ
MNAKWYIVHAYSNFEKKVGDAILLSAKEKGLQDLIEEIYVPTEEITEMRRGRKVNTERRFFPGYVLVNMVMTDDTYHLIKDTPKVTGFLGSGNKPMPVPQKEVDRIRGVVEDGETAPRLTITFEIGETVHVTDGPFASFSGVVEDVDEETTRLKVAVSIFGRATPVELEFTQVEKSN